VFTYQIRKPANWTSGELEQASDQFKVLTGDFASTCAAIREDRLDAAVLLDVGMVPHMSLLAASRLAPVQCTTWGHPETSGSPMIDCYFSSELMEPADGDQHYTEKLERLPGIGVCYQRPLIPKPLIDARREKFGLHPHAVVYLCSQSAWKYLPTYDRVLIEIAKRVPVAQFVFLSHRPEIGATLRARIEKAFREAGMDAARHCVFLPLLGKLDFWAINLVADVFLDSIGWSGFNTTMEAVACGLPVVTLPGQLMRGRHSYAILRQLGVTGTIAANEEEYISMAARLSEDRQWREGIVREMSAGESRLFADTRSIRAVEDWLVNATNIVYTDCLTPPS
jgi:predicted O-linked N-acetylglucosamine transferase (SPINDLY family)